MSAGGDDLRRRFARYLRQRGEVGMPAVVFEGLDRAEVLDLIARRPPARAARPAPHAAASLPADPTSRAPAAASSPRDPTSRAHAVASSPQDRTSAPHAAKASPQDTPPAPASAAADMAELDYDNLRDTALACTRCRLAEGRTQVVFSDGNSEARLMVVGEAPGANEDRTGLPFVGAAGKLLDLMLASVDLSRRESVYICNVIKCRPPGNRNPQADEIAACAPYLRRQIALVRPEAILAVGTFAAQLLTGAQNALGKIRGSVYSYEGVPLVVTYHPAALLRNPGWGPPTWDDLQLLRQVLDA